MRDHVVFQAVNVRKFFKGYEIEKPNTGHRNERPKLPKINDEISVPFDDVDKQGNVIKSKNFTGTVKRRNKNLFLIHFDDTEILWINLRQVDWFYPKYPHVKLILRNPVPEDDQTPPERPPPTNDQLPIKKRKLEVDDEVESLDEFEITAASRPI